MRRHTHMCERTCMCVCARADMSMYIYINECVSRPVSLSLYMMCSWLMLICTRTQYAKRDVSWFSQKSLKGSTVQHASS